VPVLRNRACLMSHDAHPAALQGKPFVVETGAKILVRSDVRAFVRSTGRPARLSAWALDCVRWYAGVWRWTSGKTERTRTPVELIIYPAATFQTLLAKTGRKISILQHIKNKMTRKYEWAGANE